MFLGKYIYFIENLFTSQLNMLTEVDIRKKGKFSKICLSGFHGGKTVKIVICFIFEMVKVALKKAGGLFRNNIYIA